MGKRADLRLGTLRAEGRRRHVIEEALDFARMPALARMPITPPIPPNIVEVMRIAAGSAPDCRKASDATGESTETLVEAARFYLQQVLFRTDADSYRVLGLEPGASREKARDHMRWLLQWVHPDRNAGLDAVYAERVVRAWRVLSSAAEIAEDTPPPRSRRARRPAQFRIPWIENPAVTRRDGGGYLTVAVWTLSGVLIALVLAGSAIWFFGLHPAAAVAAG